MTIEEIENLLNKNQIAVSYKLIEVGKDQLGLPIYQRELINNPVTNYKFIRAVENEKVAVLEDLDYKEVSPNETTNNA